ncbi:MAG: 1,4-dihydroxy-6-naphthoate synthase [Bacteroidetes bacterium 4572_128]|nr:MAG: 1,4-dihydroxy-6-naphthoate synthase [Bacteroidetes bacterium 4572_128]
MKLKLGISTCPNDTFIFDAMLHHKINTEGLEFELILADVEELNYKALKKNIDIVKMSYHAYCYLSENYTILDYGSAIGYKNGPILISKKDISLEEINDIKIAIPGEKTTANLLLKIAFPEAKNKKEFLFSEIENAIISDRFDAGLIIHENRFTYKKRNLKKIIDLGEFWENKTQMPIPLGAIVVNNKLERNLQLKINRILKRSVDFAFANPKESFAFIKKYSQEMSEDVIYKHINLYVNHYTKNLSFDGKKAIKTLFEISENLKIVPKISKNIFL